ncbi:hypothetical protein ACFCX4_05455 [Kitasatospora sp. NPDC056327]|uniref:hypothetical protein n=1 Tax=Kitasatospora sp. NPDC056327 TaxID=3345785 RepID=UPI0035E00943
MVDYAEMSLVYFHPVRWSAESLAGEDATEGEIRSFTLRIIGDMIDRGVTVGDVSPNPGEDLIPWRLSRAETLSRISDEMERKSTVKDFIEICWFRTI